MTPDSGVLVTEDRAERLIEPIYEAACDQSLWPNTLQAMSEATSSLCATHFLWRKDREALDFFIGSKEYSGDGEYRAHYSSLDPRRRLTQRLPEGGILRCHEHLDEAYVAQSPFYQDFSLKHDRRFLMSVHLIKTDQMSCFAVLHRTGAQGPFSDDDTQFFQALQPHLRRAAQIGMRVTEIEEATRRTESVMDRLPFGVLVADGQGRAISTNRMADEIVRGGDGLIIRGGRLSTANEGLSTLLVEHLRCATDPRDGSARRGATLFVDRPSGKPALRLLIAPLPENGPIVLGRTSRPTALVLINDPERVATPPEDQLRSLFGLTKGEAQVALGIASGKAADEIAHERAVSVGTVRTQLKALLQKTETDRQAELVRLLLTIPTVATQPQGPGSV